MKMMTSLLRAAPMVLGALVAAGCATQSEESFENDEGHIVGGQAEAGFQAVGLLEVVDVDVETGEKSKSTCSATLIRADVVLSSAHCFDPTYPYEFESVTFFTGDGPNVPAGDPTFWEKVTQTMTRHDVASVEALPYGGYGAPDFALLKLTAPIAGVAPLDVAFSGFVEPTTSPEFVRAGQECTVVGFGFDSSDFDFEAGGFAGRFGGKRSGKVKILPGATQGWFTYAAADGSPFFGDSGGPVVCNGKVSSTISSFLPSDEETWAFWQPGDDAMDLKWIGFRTNAYPALAFFRDTYAKWGIDDPVLLAALAAHGD